MNLAQSYPKASPAHRLSGFALDLALALVTCYIGWFIWSLVIWNQGLTPGKQILKMKVVASKTGMQATWGHMAIRQFLIPLVPGLLFTPLQLVVNTLSLFSYETYYGYTREYTGLGWLVLGFAYLAVLAFWLFDSFRILYRGENRRFTDVWAKTDVLNMAAGGPSQPSVAYNNSFGSGQAGAPYQYQATPPAPQAAPMPQAQAMHCSQCGVQLKPNTAFCFSCGSPTNR